MSGRQNTEIDYTNAVNNGGKRVTQISYFELIHPTNTLRQIWFQGIFNAQCFWKNGLSSNTQF